MPVASIFIFLPANLPAHNSWLQTGRKICGQKHQAQQQLGACHSVIAASLKYSR